MNNNKIQFNRKYYFFVLLIYLSTPHSFSQKKISRLDKQLKETSGLQFLPSGNLVSINDSGNPSEIFILNQKGQLINKIKVNNFKNNDWEAVTIDHQNQLYIGDFGNNANIRKNLSIGVFDSNFESKDSITPKYTIQFNYEDQKHFPPKENNLRFDCEAFIVIDSNIYLFSKSRVKPFDGKSYIYHIKNKPGQQTAQIIDTLQLSDNGMIKNWVTDANYNIVTKQIVILTTKKVYTLEYKQTFKIIHTQKLKGLKQREAITFTDKQNQFFITDEKHFILGGGKLYKYQLDD